MRFVGVLTEERVEIHYKHEGEDNPVSRNLNILVECLITSWASLCLYEALDMLQERVLYFDMDSVIFRNLPDQPDPSPVD